jgi:hypothetical protein
MTPKGIGTVVHRDKRRRSEFGVRMGESDGKHVRPLEWFRAEEMEEVEE